jgi:hypothetical protein
VDRTLASVDRGIATGIAAKVRLVVEGYWAIEGYRVTEHNGAIEDGVTVKLSRTTYREACAER